MAWRTDQKGQPVVTLKGAPAHGPRPGSALMQQRAAGAAGDRDGHATSAGLAVSARANRRPSRHPGEDKGDGDRRHDKAALVAPDRLCRWRRREERHRLRVGNFAAAQVSGRLTLTRPFSRGVTSGKLP